MCWKFGKQPNTQKAKKSVFPAFGQPNRVLAWSRRATRCTVIYKQVPANRTKVSPPLSVLFDKPSPVHFGLKTKRVGEKCSACTETPPDDFIDVTNVRFIYFYSPGGGESAEGLTACADLYSAHTTERSIIKSDSSLPLLWHVSAPTKSTFHIQIYNKSFLIRLQDFTKVRFILFETSNSLIVRLWLIQSTRTQ